MRYWANIVHETTYVEVDADVNEECISVIAMVKAHQITMEKVTFSGHEISGIASHFAMHILRFASQLHFCIANFAMQYS